LDSSEPLSSLVGDSYVAVAGIPNPQPTHAVIISRFAWECLLRFNEVVKEMEVELVSTGNGQAQASCFAKPVSNNVLFQSGS
jgi:hypothetical protein